MQNNNLGVIYLDFALLAQLDEPSKASSSILFIIPLGFPPEIRESAEFCLLFFSGPVEPLRDGCANDAMTATPSWVFDAYFRGELYSIRSKFSFEQFN